MPKNSSKKPIVLDHVSLLANSLNEVLKVTCNNKFREPIFKLLKAETSDEAADAFKGKLGKLMVNKEKASSSKQEVKRKRKKAVPDDAETEDEEEEIPVAAATAKPTEDAKEKRTAMATEGGDSDIEFLEMRPMSPSTMKKIKLDFSKPVKAEKESQQSTSSNSKLQLSFRTPPTPTQSLTPTQPLACSTPRFEIELPPSPPSSPSLLEDADLEILTYTQTMSQRSQYTQNSFGSGSLPF